MNDRATKILNILLKNPDCKVTQLEKMLGLTRRQVNYSLMQVNDWLSESGLPPIVKKQTGEIKLPKEIIKKYADQEQGLVNIAFYSENERKDLICLYLAISNECVSLNHLIDILHVSRNTVVNDIKNINLKISSYNLTIDYSRQDGYEIQGDEFQVRSLIENIVQTNIQLKRDFSFIEDYFDLKKDETIHLVRQVEKSIGVNYSDDSFDFLVTIFMYIFQRIKLKNSHLYGILGDQVKESREYACLQEILEDSIYKEDIEWISLMFIASTVYVNDKSYLTIDDDTLYQLVHNMILDFEAITLIEIKNPIKFETRLFNHLRPACFRIMYDIKVSRYYLETDKQEYGVLKTLISDLIKPIENYIGKPFPREELDLLTLYFGTQLHSLHANDVPKAKAVVVCSNGLIVSKMMLEILRNLFPEIHFLSSLSVREFVQFESDYDLVFSTNPLSTTISQYIINPIMTDEEQIRLRYRVLEDIGLSDSNSVLTDIIDTIEKYAKIDDIKSLKSELGYRLVQPQRSMVQDKKIMPNLSYYLSLEGIRICDQKMAWEEAIAFAFAPLLKQGMITDNYVSKAIEEYKDSETYSFFGEWTAVPHVDLKDCVHQEVIGMTVFKEGVRFPNGKVIHLIAPIAIIDTTRHLLAIKQFSEYVMANENINRLLTLDDSVAIYQDVLERM